MWPLAQTNCIPIGVDTTEKLRLEIHAIEAKNWEIRVNPRDIPQGFTDLSMIWSQLDSISSTGASWRVPSL